jgi:hypothetical protein
VIQITFDENSPLFGAQPAHSKRNGRFLFAAKTSPKEERRTQMQMESGKTDSPSFSSDFSHLENMGRI